MDDTKIKFTVCVVQGLDYIEICEGVTTIGICKDADENGPLI